MRLLIMRHGEAEPYTGEQTDRDRELTPVGSDQARQAARSIARPAPQRVLVSPYRRTQQTAAMVCAELGRIEWQTCDWLRSGAPLDQATLELDKLDGASTLLISHMPLVSLLVEYYTGEQLGFQTANIAQIDMEHAGREQGELSWRHR